MAQEGRQRIGWACRSHAVALDSARWVGSLSVVAQRQFDTVCETGGMTRERDAGGSEKKTGDTLDAGEKWANSSKTRNQGGGVCKMLSGTRDATAPGASSRC